MNKYKTNCITKTCKKNNDRDSWIIKENTHEPIIERQKYDMVQKIKFGKKVMTNVKYEYLLQDLLYCGYCKRKLQYKVYKSADRQTLLYDSAGFNCSVAYKSKCKNKTYIREKDLNEIIKNEVIKRLKLFEIDKVVNRLIEYYKENDKNMKKIKAYKNEIGKLERKKSVLYKKKCEQYISIEEFKSQYASAKEEIEMLDNLIIELCSKNDCNKLEETRIREIIADFKNGNCLDNDFLKEIVNKIEIYSKNRIEVTFKL